MNHWTRRALNVALCATLAASSLALGDDDDAPKPAGPAAAPTLNAEQQRAVGLQVLRPRPATAPGRTQAIGTVLDPSALLDAQGRLAVSAAEEQAAASELERLEVLRKTGAAASLKTLEAARAEAVKTRAEAQLSRARFAEDWGPLGAEPRGARQRLLDEAAAGRLLLVRADLPGRHVVGALPGKALLDVDGMELPGRVLGVLRRPSEQQSAGLLVEVRNPPAGLAPGARIALVLLGAAQAGLLVPNEALLYGESGAYVYKRIPPKTAAEPVRYVPVKVTPLVPYGEGWLVRGVDDDDEIVVHGAGVLWSLEGVGARPADDDEDD